MSKAEKLDFYGLNLLKKILIENHSCMQLHFPQNISAQKRLEIVCLSALEIL